MTTAKEARRQLLALLQAAPTLAGVQVTYSGPVTSDEVAPEMVFMGDTRASSDWSELGALQREENYTIDLFLKIWKAHADGSEQAVEERCWDLFGAIEDALYTDPELGGLLAGPGIQISEWEQIVVPTVEPKGFAGTAAMKVRCCARVRPAS